MSVVPDPTSRFTVIADGPLDSVVMGLLGDQIDLLPWQTAIEGTDDPVDGIYTYGHPPLNGEMLDRIPGTKVISNYGVGVDHINVADAVARSILVGNTPGILDGATADMAMALLLSAARRVIEGDRYARSSEFLRYDPGFMLGREVHHSVLGIIGMGSIGSEVARRARAFDMNILYHNRHPREDVARSFKATYVSLKVLLEQSDFVMLCCPLTEKTYQLIDAEAIARMKRTAFLINIARGPVVDTAAIYHALRDRRIEGAAFDVTDPEPLPRDHPILQLDNLTIVPHLGSATVETRRKMSEISVANLKAGMCGEPLLYEVKP